MIRLEQWMDIKELQRMGLSVREIARRTGHSRNTIRKLTDQRTAPSFHKPLRPSCLDPYKPYLKERFENFGLSAVRLLGEIRPQGYAGSINLVQRYLKTLRDAKTVSGRATVRFETAPGQQAQADWAHVGEDELGKVYAFVMVLSFSRMLFVEFTRSMNTHELIRCHQNAFAYFGGIPSAVLFDNQAQVRLPNGEWNPLFADFAAHYGFSIKTHRPYRPRTKGKVERMVDYLKDNFLRGRVFAGFDDLAHQGRLWLEESNGRIHATTGERPQDLLARENLTPFTSVAPYVLAERHPRRVDAEGYVSCESARYSVPPEHVGQRVIVVVGEQRVQVRRGDTIIAEHAKAAPGECRAAKEHVEAMWQRTLERSPSPAVAAVATEITVQLVSSETVAATPLSLYDDLVESLQEVA
jgi:transposase